MTGVISISVDTSDLESYQTELLLLGRSGLLPDFMAQTVEGAKAYAERITHRITGRLAAGHRVMGRGLEWVLFNDVPYAGYEHDRGGPHAFYDRMLAEEYPRLERAMIRGLEERL